VAEILNITIIQQDMNSKWNIFNYQTLKIFLTTVVIGKERVFFTVLN